MRGLSVIAVILAFLAFLTPQTAAAHQDATSLGRADDAELDLSAMMPTPAELEAAGLEGYAIRNGWTDTFDDELIGFLEGDLSAGEIEEQLDSAGYLRTRATRYDLASDNEPDWAARRLQIYIDEYSGDDGLMDVMDMFLNYPDAEALDGTVRIGDDAVIVGYSEVMADSGAETEWVVLGFSYGNLTAQIMIGDFLEYEPDITPSVEEVEAIGQLLEAKMASVIEAGAPGLSTRALRFESDGENVVYIDDFYARRGDETLPLYGDAARATADADQSGDDSGMLDVYSLEQWIGRDGDYAIDWNVNVRTFEDEVAASDWLFDVPGLAESTSDVSEFEQADDPELGDEAIAFTYVHPGTYGEEDFSWSDTLVRIDDTVVTISIGRLGGPAPAELVDELIGAELECLESGSCSAESPAPEELLDLAASDLGDAPAAPSNDDAPSEQELLARVETYGNLSQEHVEGTVDYEQVPPVGGAHNGVPQTCGFYDAPIGSEHAVHSMEHGAVWVTYDPELPAPDVRVLEELTHEHDYLLVSPFDGLPAPVVASAWGVQILLDGVDDPYLQAFIDYFEEGPQNPEPGASCSGTTEMAS